MPKLTEIFILLVRHETCEAPFLSSSLHFLKSRRHPRVPPKSKRFGTTAPWTPSASGGSHTLCPIDSALPTSTKHRPKARTQKQASQAGWHALVCGRKAAQGGGYGKENRSRDAVVAHHTSYLPAQAATVTVACVTVSLGHSGSRACGLH